MAVVYVENSRFLTIGRFPGSCRGIKVQKIQLPNGVKSDLQASVRAHSPTTFFSAGLEILAGSGRQRQNVAPTK